MFYYGCWDGDNHKAQQLTQFQIDDNVTWVKGKHTLKFGFKGRQEYNNVVELQQAQGSDSFYGDWTAQYDPVGTAGCFLYRLGPREPGARPSYLSFESVQPRILLFPAEGNRAVRERYVEDYSAADGGRRSCDGITGLRTRRNMTGSVNIDLTTLNQGNMQVMLPEQHDVDEHSGHSLRRNRLVGGAGPDDDDGKCRAFPVCIDSEHLH